MTRPLIVLVVGTGRSGTSSTARILHEKLGINMGENFPEPNWQSPRGAYEEQTFFWTDAQLLNGEINFPFWISVLKDRALTKQAPWGYKSPLLAYTLPLHLSFLPPDPIIIRADRSIEACAKSCMRCYNWSEEKAYAEMNERKRLLDLHLKGHKHYVINFDEPLSDDQIETKLREIINGEGFSLSS